MRQGFGGDLTGVFVEATGSDSLVVGELRVGRAGDFLLGSADMFCQCHSLASGRGLDPSPGDSQRDYNQTKSHSRFSLSSPKSQWSPD